MLSLFRTYGLATLLLLGATLPTLSHANDILLRSPLSQYCALIMQKVTLRSKPLARQVRGLVENLITTEEQNTAFTTRYRVDMQERSELRLWITRMLDSDRISLRERMHLEERLAEVRQELQKLTIEHLAHTRVFEEIKGGLNVEIAGITGEERALIEAAKNRFYAEESMP